MKKVSKQMPKMEVYDKPEMTLGLDMGDRYSHYCLLNAARRRGRGGPHAKHRSRAPAAFRGRAVACASRLECGTHSPWVSRLLKALGPPGHRGQRTQDSGHHRQRIEERPQRCREAGPLCRLRSQAAFAARASQPGAPVGPEPDPRPRHAGARPDHDRQRAARAGQKRRRPLAGLFDRVASGPRAQRRFRPRWP